MIRWEIDPIERILKEVPAFLSKRAHDARSAAGSGSPSSKRLSDEDSYLAAHRLTHESVVYHLNAVIDWVLLALATRVLPPEQRMTPEALSRSRAQLIRAIERQYQIDVKQLRGWDQIERLREDANALKHRGGINLLESSPMGIPRSARVTLESLGDRLAGARDWLLHLWNSTEGAALHGNA